MEATKVEQEFIDKNFDDIFSEEEGGDPDQDAEEVLSSDTLMPLLDEFQAMADRLSEEMSQQTPLEIPSEYQDIADLYTHIHEVYGLVKNIYESIRHNRELLKVAATRVMEFRGIKSIISTDGTAVTDVRTIYASIKDRGLFVDWARSNGREDLLETKERKGSAKTPGLDAHVRYLVNQHRTDGNELVLPPGIDYAETVRLTVRRKSEGDKFDDGAKGILERIKEKAAAKEF